MAMNWGWQVLDIGYWVLRHRSILHASAPLRETLWLCYIGTAQYLLSNTPQSQQTRADGRLHLGMDDFDAGGKGFHCSLHQPCIEAGAQKTARHHQREVVAH